MITTLKLIAIRFAFLISTLFVLFFNNGAFSFFYYLQKYTSQYQTNFVLWFGRSILGMFDLAAVFNGSGDTTFAYVQLLFIALISLIGTIIWSVFDRNRKSHEQLLYWLIATLRFYVGFMLIHYGLAKLNNGQFPGPSAYGMSVAYGDFSPMGLAWRFLGFSEGYKVFMFFAEMMGTLLLFRRTATIGAFLCLMTCLNIMAINYFFDVPVKLLSTALVTMCLIILSPNFKRLFNFFFLGKTALLNPINPRAFPKKWMRITKEILKYSMIFFCAAAPTIGTLIVTVQGKPVEKASIYNRYDVTAIDWTDGTPPQSLPYFVSHWKYIGLDKSDYAFINYGQPENLNCRVAVDEKAKMMTFSFNDNPEKYSLNYRLYAGDSLEVKGNFFGKPIIMKLQKKEFELIKNSFRWINERPYNR